MFLLLVFRTWWVKEIRAWKGWLRRQTRTPQERGKKAQVFSLYKHLTKEEEKHLRGEIFLFFYFLVIIFKVTALKIRTLPLFYILFSRLECLQSVHEISYTRELDSTLISILALRYKTKAASSPQEELHVPWRGRRARCCGLPALSLGRSAVAVLRAGLTHAAAPLHAGGTAGLPGARLLGKSANGEGSFHPWFLPP